MPAAVFARIFDAFRTISTTFVADAIHLGEIRPHPFQHDPPVDVHHVRMPDLPPVHDIRHLHARLQFVALHLHREDADLACLQIVQNLLRQIASAAAPPILQHERLVRRAHLLQFVHEAAAISLRRLIGDDRDFLRGLHAQAHVHRIARARSQFGIERDVYSVADDCA